MDKHIAQQLYGQLLNEHRKLTNDIADIKAASYELSMEDKKKVDQLQKRQIELMNQMRVLFNK